jgi:hypothetical protein
MWCGLEVLRWFAAIDYGSAPLTGLAQMLGTLTLSVAILAVVIKATTRVTRGCELGANLLDSLLLTHFNNDLKVIKNAYRKGRSLDLDDHTPSAFFRDRTGLGCPPDVPAEQRRQGATCVSPFTRAPTPLHKAALDGKTRSLLS